MRIRRIRAERFGAVVATDLPAALLSVDRALARRLGVDGADLWRSRDPGLSLPVLSGPTEVHVATTERCAGGCVICYVDAVSHGHEPTTGELTARLRAVAIQGAFNVTFGGGEPLGRPDLGDLALVARDLGMTPTLTTSGAGLTEARVAELRAFAQVNVSVDLAGMPGAGRAQSVRAIELLCAGGVTVGVNAILTRAGFPHVEALASEVESIGASELQLLRLKPSGRAAPHYRRLSLGPDQIAELPDLLARLSGSRKMSIRVDCALIPFLVDRVPIDRMEAFGVLGCEAGRSLMTVDARGRARPCSVWDGSLASAPSVLDAAWNSDETLGAMRRFARALPTPCADCAGRAVCRGGCRVVSLHVLGTPFAPDPECPRVRGPSVAAAPDPSDRSEGGIGDL